MSKIVVCLSALLVFCLSYAVLPTDASECYRYYTNYLDENMNRTVRSQHKCPSEYCWRAHMSFPDGQLENDKIEGGCIDDCTQLGENHCLYGDEVPNPSEVRIRDAVVFNKVSYSKAKALCCCKGNFCNSANQMKTGGVLAVMFITLLFGLFSF